MDGKALRRLFRLPKKKAVKKLRPQKLRKKKRVRVLGEKKKHYKNQVRGLMASMRRIRDIIRSAKKRSVRGPIMLSHPVHVERYYRRRRQIHRAKLRRMRERVYPSNVEIELMERQHKMRNGDWQLQMYPVPVKKIEQYKKFLNLSKVFRGRSRARKALISWKAKYPEHRPRRVVATKSAAARYMSFLRRIKSVAPPKPRRVRVQPNFTAHPMALRKRAQR